MGLLERPRGILEGGVGDAMDGFLVIRAEKAFAVDGTVTDWSRGAATREEALDVLNEAQEQLDAIREHVEATWHEESVET